MTTTAEQHRGSRAPRRLCIFARVPVLGRVKQRLAAALGEAAALAAHETLVAGCLERCIDPSAFRCELWIHGGPPDHPGVRRWLGRHGLAVFRQSGRDLGERMHDALTRELDQGIPAVLIGTDCPDIDRAYVSAAFAALDSDDVVLGPAEDGGYGLVGIRRPLPTLFADMPWGSHRVLGETLARARAAGASVALLEQIYDVDRPEDWARFTGARIRPPGTGTQ